MTIPFKFLKMYFSSFIGIAIAAFFLAVLSSCQILMNSKNSDKNGEAKQTVVEIPSHVDSLVRTGHPNLSAFLDSATQASPEPEIKNLFRKYTAISYYYSKYEKNDTLAEIYADSALQLFERNRYVSDDKLLYLYAILNKGDILLQQHNYGTAIPYFIQGRRLIDPETTPCIAAEYLRGLGSISYQQKNYRNSIDFYSRAWRLSAHCATYGDFSWFQLKYRHYHHLSSNYRGLQMPDSALYYGKWALALLVEAGASGRFSENANHRHFLEVAKGMTYSNIGTSNKALGRGKKAVHYWKMGIAINTRSGFANEHAELARLRLAGYYVKEGRLEEAKKELALARKWLDKNSSEAVELRWWRMRWRWLARTGNNAQEHAAYRRYVKLKEASLQNKAEESSIDIAARIRLSEQQHNIEGNLRESKLQEIYLVVAVIGSLLIIVIIFLIGRSRRQSKKKVQELAGLSKKVFSHKLQLEKSNETITRIMNIMAHDLKNPLISIHSISSILLRDDDLMDDQKQDIRLMHNSSKSAMEMIDQLLSSKVLDDNENKYESIEKEFTDLRPYLKSCVEVLQFRAGEKGQIIELDDFEEDAAVSLNHNAIFRVIGNLIENAIKFSYKGSTIRLGVENLGDAVLLSVRDNGIGIPGNLKEKVFDIFTDAKRQGTSGEQSFGLGLSISRQIVEAHGGSIWIESEEEKGTTVYIKLPVVVQHSEVK